MKRLFLALALAVLTSGRVLAQGEIIFENYFGGGNSANAPAYFWDGMTLLTGPAYEADLLFGGSATTVNQDAGFAVPFRSGAGAGYFLGGPQQIALGGTVFMEIVVWQSAAGATWAGATGGATEPYDMFYRYSQNGGNYFIFSPVFSEVLPSGINPPVSFAGLISPLSNIPIPEPSPTVLGIFGAAVLFLFRRRKKA